MRHALFCLLGISAALGCASHNTYRSNYGPTPMPQSAIPSYSPPTYQAPTVTAPDNSSGPALPGLNSSRQRPRGPITPRDHVANYRPTNTNSQMLRYNPPGKGYIELPPPGE